MTGVLGSNVRSFRYYEIRDTKRPHYKRYSEKLNLLVDRMLTIDVHDRITIEQILAD